MKNWQRMQQPVGTGDAPQLHERADARIERTSGLGGHRRGLAKNIEEIRTMDLSDETVFGDLANKYGVSTQAITFRLAYLGYVQT